MRITVGRRRMVALALAGMALAPLTTGSVTARAAPIRAPGIVTSDWPQYLHDSTRAGFTPDNAITTTDAHSLAMRPGWPVNVGGVISTQPVVANGIVYSGSWNGDEYAVSTSGAVIWRTALGITTPADPNCGGGIGVASTPAVATVTISGDTRPSSVLFLGAGGNDAVGGGSAKLVALDAATGAVRWQTVLGPAPSTLIYSSPLVVTPPNASVPSVFIGVASYGDCPLVQGKLLAIDARTGWVQHEFDVVPAACGGAGIWGSPTYDPADGSLYVATGNADPCTSPEPYAEAVVKLRSWDLSVAASWQVPATEGPGDSDFGSTPTLFTGTVSRGGAPRSLVGVGNKNGTFYVFDRATLGQGPVARLPIAVGGTCPECGQGTISPAAYDGTTLYIGGGAPPGGGSSLGVLRAFDPNNLASPRWTKKMSRPVLGAVTAAPGVVVACEGSTIVVLAARTGAARVQLQPGTGMFYAAPSISGGVLYAGDSNGTLVALSVNGA